MEPRLILVASGYSGSTLTAARYVGVPLTLYTYSYLDVGGVRGLQLKGVDIRPPRTFSKEATKKKYRRGC